MNKKDSKALNRSLCIALFTLIFFSPFSSARAEGCPEGYKKVSGTNFCHCKSPQWDCNLILSSSNEHSCSSPSLPTCNGEPLHTKTPTITPEPSETVETPTVTPTVDPTSVVPTATPTPSACAAVQQCIDLEVADGIVGCLNQSTECNAKNPAKFAVSATEIATRAITIAGCNSFSSASSKSSDDRKGKKGKSKGACNLCFQKAKLPLQSRYDGSLFHGLLGNAVSIVEQTRRSVCNSLSK